MYRDPSRPLSRRVCLILLVLLWSVATAGTAGAASVALPTTQLTVDCDAGEKLADALSTYSFELVVEFTGTCVEDPLIERDHVELRSDGTGVIEGRLHVRGAQHVHLEGFTVQNGTGILINESSAAELVGISSLDNTSIGINVTDNSYAKITDAISERNNFANLSVSGSSRALVVGSLVANESDNSGIFVGGASDLQVNVTSIELNDNLSFGASIEGSSHANFNRYHASGNGNLALRAFLAGSVYVNQGVVSGDVHIVEGSSAELQNLDVSTGTIGVLENSSARLSLVDILQNDLWVRDSTVRVWLGSLAANLRLDENATLNLNYLPYTVGGSVFCHSTALLYDTTGTPACP